MELLWVIGIIAYLIASYAVPGFILSLLSVTLHRVAIKKTKSIRELAKEAARLTPAATIVLFVGLLTLQNINYFLSPPPLEKVSAETFGFDIYAYHRDDLHEALTKLFPVGTPKKDVDAILVNKAGATSNANEAQLKSEAHDKGKARVFYSRRIWPWTCYPMSGTPELDVLAEYDADLKIVFWSTSVISDAGVSVIGCGYF